MKKIQILLFSLLLLLGATSCEHETLDTYSGHNDVFFEYGVRYNAIDNQKILTDSMIIRFGYDKVPKADSIIKIKVMLFGDVLPYDRPINFLLEPEDAENTAKLGEDIELLYDQSILPANEVYGVVCVKIKNTPKLETQTLKATIKTKPNEHFEALFDKVVDMGTAIDDVLGTKLVKDINDEGLVKTNTIKLYFNSSFEMPSLWADLEDRFTRNVFGPYSKTKLDFVCSTLNLDYDYFMYDASTQKATTVFNERFPISIIGGWKLILEIALQEYKDEHGEALKDEHGEYVIIGKFDPHA